LTRAIDVIHNNFIISDHLSLIKNKQQETVETVVTTLELISLFKIWSLSKFPPWV